MKNFFKRKLSLTAVLVLLVFFIMLVSMIVIGAVVFLLTQLGVFDLVSHRGIFAPLLVMLLFSILLGTGITAVISRRTLQPLRKIIAATQQVAGGDFTVQLALDNVPEIDDLTLSFNKMVQQLAGIETLRSDFISNFSHEFKTPIVSIRGFAKLLRNSELTKAERDEYIDIIVSESERLVELSTNVLDLTKLEHLEIVSEKESFALDEQIRRAALLMEPRWREKGIMPALELEPVTIFSNPDMLQQVWVNLLDNAIKFCGDCGKIAISLRRREERAIVTVEDDGCGMDEPTLRHLFDKFYQGDASHTKPGNGLGLAMVKRIVELCNGAIEVSSEQGRGSRFTVTLPLQPD